VRLYLGGDAPLPLLEVRAVARRILAYIEEEDHGQRTRELQGHIDRKAEITQGMTPAEREAWEERHRDAGRALQYYIDRAKDEQEAKRKSA
jgi:hypothetical protein